jgi:hypothetical protein
MADVIEFFTVPPDEDAAFLAAWTAEAAPGSTLLRALRPETPERYASLSPDASTPPAGVLLIVPFDVPDGEDGRFLGGWEKVRERFSVRQGYLGAQMLHSAEDRHVGIVHWSSPLMYARTVREEGDVIAALPFVGDPAMYVRA